MAACVFECKYKNHCDSSMAACMYLFGRTSDKCILCAKKDACTELLHSDPPGTLVPEPELTF